MKQVSKTVPQNVQRLIRDVLKQVDDVNQDTILNEITSLLYKKYSNYETVEKRLLRLNLITTSDIKEMIDLYMYQMKILAVNNIK